ncbi:MAG: hypothetical protein OIF57_17610 [Marinobacterium sp.]|nr:hypothetical protein [Marinobacterium sp.]
MANGAEKVHHDRPQHSDVSLPDIRHQISSTGLPAPSFPGNLNLVDNSQQAAFAESDTL